MAFNQSSLCALPVLLQCQHRQHRSGRGRSLRHRRCRQCAARWTCRCCCAALPLAALSRVGIDVLPCSLSALPRPAFGGQPRVAAPKRSRLFCSGLLDMRTLYTTFLVQLRSLRCSGDIAAAQISVSVSYPEVSMCQLIRFALHAHMSHDDVQPGRCLPAAPSLLVGQTTLPTVHNLALQRLAAIL